jgi:hypothetical protein
MVQAEITSDERQSLWRTIATENPLYQYKSIIECAGDAHICGPV